ncbi:MAG TPA: hypothetical protein VNO18_16835, partial [Xanthobacteraceae bacterium]|nr:hypothetical protein [Xanthobacteraceae bacterium]
GCRFNLLGLPRRDAGRCKPRPRERLLTLTKNGKRIAELMGSCCQLVFGRELARDWPAACE